MSRHLEDPQPTHSPSARVDALETGTVDALDELLAQLTRETASDGFTERVLLRVRSLEEDTSSAGDPVTEALRGLPTDVARPGFKTAVMARVREPRSGVAHVLSAVWRALLGPHPERTAPVLAMAVLVAAGLGAVWSDFDAGRSLDQGARVAAAGDAEAAEDRVATLRQRTQAPILRVGGAGGGAVDSQPLGQLQPIFVDSSADAGLGHTEPTPRVEYQQLERELALLRSLTSTSPLFSVPGADGVEYWIDLEEPRLSVGSPHGQGSDTPPVSRFEVLREW